MDVVDEVNIVDISYKLTHEWVVEMSWSKIITIYNYLYKYNCLGLA